MDGSLDKLTMDLLAPEVYDRLEMDPDYIPDIYMTGKDVLDKWEECCEHGRALHIYLDHRLNLVDVDIKLAHPDLELKQVNDFLAAFAARGGEWIRTELSLGSFKDRVCGTPDALAKVDGKLVIYDLSA